MRFCLWLLWADRVLQLRPGPLPDHETGACPLGSPWPLCSIVPWAVVLGPRAPVEGLEVQRKRPSGAWGDGSGGWGRPRVALFESFPTLEPQPPAIQSWGLDPGIFKAFPSDSLALSVPLHGQPARPAGRSFLRSVWWSWVGQPRPVL